MDKVSLGHIRVEIRKDIFLSLYPIGNESKIFEIDDAEAEQYGEAPVQLLEAKRYEYKLEPSSYKLEERGKTVIPSKINKFSGRIFTGNNVGSLQLHVTGDESFSYDVEVLATKFDSSEDYDRSYRTNYRQMLSDITEKCTELIMQSNSLVNQYFEPEFAKENETLYQKFSFIKSIILSSDFEESLLKIFSSPKTTWLSESEKADVRSLKRITNKSLKELIRGQNRVPLPKSHSLYQQGKLETIATRVSSYRQKPSLDNPENRFVKHALTEYLQFCEKCKYAFPISSRDFKEASQLVNTLENYLSNPFFKSISKPTTLKLNSPTLQRKSGYRQLLKSWLMFDLAAKLTWTGGEDVYKAGKRDIATLYEYWLFFVLYDLFKEKFDLKEITHENKPYSHLLEKTAKGINLIIKSGQHTALEGKATIEHRNLKVKFSFNRTFPGRKDSFPAAGSWTMNMRPDYTLSVWPQELNEKEAEKKEQIVHIHFDAKYKVNHFVIPSKNSAHGEDLSDDDKAELDKLEIQERTGKFKNGDIYKMHTYKDAIRRTAGAYILYPGTTNSEYRGFHELIPGLGAFAINPASEKDDISELSKFIDKVVSHLVNRASQRENISSKIYSITKGGPSKPLKEPMPEYISDEKLIPDETYVLIGFSRTPERKRWYNENSMYNFRMDAETGSLVLLPKVVNAKFLLLRESGKSQASILYKLKKGIRVFSKEYLEDLGHPDVSKKHYLVYDFEKEADELQYFADMKWNFKDLDEYKKTVKGKNPRSSAGLPFTVSLTELMKVRDRGESKA